MTVLGFGSLWALNHKSFKNVWNNGHLKLTIVLFFWKTRYCINPFWPNVPFLYPLKTSEKH